MTNIFCVFENKTRQDHLYEESYHCSVLSLTCFHLFQAFVSVEKGYFDSIDDVLAEKANLQLQIPEVILIVLLMFYRSSISLQVHVHALRKHLKFYCFIL